MLVHTVLVSHERLNVGLLPNDEIGFWPRLSAHYRSDSLAIKKPARIAVDDCRLPIPASGDSVLRGFTNVDEFVGYCRFKGDFPPTPDLPGEGARFVL